MDIGDFVETKIIYFLDWTEYESGWGSRPDGMQMFLNHNELEKVLKEDQEIRKKATNTPFEYSIPESKFVCEVNLSDFSTLEKLIDNKPYRWFNICGQRDIGYLTKTYPSLKIISRSSV